MGRLPARKADPKDHHLQAHDWRQQLILRERDGPWGLLKLYKMMQRLLTLVGGVDMNQTSTKKTSHAAIVAGRAVGGTLHTEDTLAVFLICMVNSTLIMVSLMIIKVSVFSWISAKLSSLKIKATLDWLGCTTENQNQHLSTSLCS